MKKTLSLILLTVCSVLQINAQSIERGFYRVQNTYTNRYISIEDNNPMDYPISNAGTIDMSGIKTYKPGEKVSTSPSTVVYIYNVSGSQYDIEGQGTSIHEISGGRLYINLLPQADGSWQAMGHYIIDLYLKDDSDPDKTEANLKPNSKSTKAMNWWVKKVDTGSEYLGIKPDVEVDGKYYGTIFMQFPFELKSPGMKAYAVGGVSGDGFTLTEITGTVPALTACLIECSSNDPANNKIMPVESAVDLAINNMLYGVFCDRVTSKYFNATMYDATIMRVLGKNNGKLAFKTASSSDLTGGAYMKANKAFLLVPSGTPKTLVLGGGADPEPGPEPGPGPEPEPVSEFTANDATFTVGADYTVVLKNANTISGYFEIPAVVQCSSNGLNYTVVGIGENAFKDQASMSSVSIPASVTKIADNAFAGCTSLIAMYSWGEEPPVLGNNVFEGVDKDNCVISVPGGTIEKYQAAEGWKDFRFIGAIGDGISEIKSAGKTARWYSLDGQELKEQPTKKGIYISNGKKVVIK